MMLLYTFILLLTSLTSPLQCWTLNDLYEQFLSNEKPTLRHKTTRKIGNDRRNLIQLSEPRHSENDKYEVETFDIESPIKPEKKSNLHHLDKHSNVLQPTFGISNFIHENRNLRSRKPQVSAWSDWETDSFNALGDLAKKNEAARPKGKRKPVVRTVGRERKDDKFDLMLPKHYQQREQAPTPGIIATQKKITELTKAAPAFGFPCHASSPSVLCPTAPGLLIAKQKEVNKLSAENKHNVENKASVENTPNVEVKHISPIDSLIMEGKKTQAAIDLKSNDLFSDDNEKSKDVHNTNQFKKPILGNATEYSMGSHEHLNPQNISTNLLNASTSNSVLAGNSSSTEVNDDVKVNESPSPNTPLVETSPEVTNALEKLAPESANEATAADKPKPATSKMPADAIDLPDLRGILALSFEKKEFKFKECLLVAESSVCGVKVSLKGIDTLDGECNGKASFTALMKQLLPKFDLTAPSQDLIVPGKFDATGFKIDRCGGRVSFDLKCRELLDIIPNKLRISQAEVLLNFSYEQPPKDISNFNIDMKGNINLDFRSRRLTVTCHKPLGSGLYKIEMQAMDLEIPEFTKLFTDTEIPQDNLPPDLATLVTSSLRNPRISGLYDAKGAFEFVASAKSPASIFPSQPWVYCIIQKPRLGKVVSGLIANFVDAMYRSFLSSILNQDLSNLPLFTDERTDMAIGCSPDGLFVVKDEAFNKEVGSLFNAGKTIKKGLTVKAKLPIRKMLADSKRSDITQSFPQDILVNLEVTQNKMHIEFPEELRIGLSGVPELFAQHGQEMNFPKETFSVEDTELKILMYEVLDVDKKILSVKFEAPSSMKIGSLMVINNVEATLKRDALSKWSFVANGDYQLEKTSVSISLTSQNDGFTISSKPSSIRSGLLINLLDKEKKYLIPELNKYHMQDFVIDNFKIAGSLTDKNIIRFSGIPSVSSVDDGSIEVTAVEDNNKQFGLALGILFKNVDLDKVFGRMLDTMMMRTSWAKGVNIGLIVGPTSSPLEFQFESEGLSRTKILPGVHLRVLLARPDYSVCKGDSLCRVLSAEMPKGSAFHLSGGFTNGMIELSASIKEPLVLTRSLQLTDVTLQVQAKDSIKIYVLASLALRGVGIPFKGDMQVDNTGQLQLNMKSDSTWDEPFGLKNVRFYNCSLNAVFEPGLQLPVFDMKAKMQLGPATQESSKIIETDAIVKISSQDPAKNSFSAKIRDLSFERLASACGTKKPLLRFQQESLVIEEATLSYAQNNKEEVGNERDLNSTDYSYQGELKVTARMNVLGQIADSTTKFLQKDTQLLTEIWLPDIGVNHGLLSIHAGLKQAETRPLESPVSNGPTLLIRMDSLTNSAVIVGKISTLGFSRISAIKIEDTGFSATIFASLPGNVNTNVSLHSPYKENIQAADFMAAACLPIQEETKTALFKVLRETATQTKKTLIAAEERVTSTEKIYETTKAMIDKYKKRSNTYTVDIRERAETMTKLRKGIKRHCVRDCGDSCMGLPSWKRSGISLAGRNAIGAPSWDPCRKKIPDLNCITRCLGRKVIENVKANNKQQELQILMTQLTDTKRSLQDAKHLVDRARELVDATLERLEKVNKEIKVGIDISKFLNDGKAEEKIEILKVCFQDTLDNAERSLVKFNIGTADHGEEKSLEISAALDGNLEANIAEGIANKLYPGFYEFSKKLEQVKVLLSNLDGEISEITKQITKISEETISGEKNNEQKSQIVWTTEEDEFRRLAFGELPRFTLSDDDTIHAFEEKSLWQIAPSNNPLYDSAPGDNQILQKEGGSNAASFIQDFNKQTTCGQIRSSVNRYSDIINPLSEFTENFLQEKIMFYRQKNRRLADLRMIDDQIKSDCFLENCTMEDMDNALSYLARARDGTLKWANVIDNQIEQQNKVALGYFSQRTADIISTDKGVSLKQYISKVKEMAQTAIRKSDIAEKVEADGKIQKLAKELHGLLLGVRSGEELSKVAPRIFSMKRQIQSLKRNKIPCSETKVNNKQLLSLPEDQKLHAVNDDDASSKITPSEKETMKIADKKTVTKPPTRHPRTTLKPKYTENPVLKNKILHHRDIQNKINENKNINNNQKDLKKEEKQQERKEVNKKEVVTATTEALFPDAPPIENNNKKELIQTQENLNHLFFGDASLNKGKALSEGDKSNDNSYNPFSYWNNYGKWKRSS